MALLKVKLLSELTSKKSFLYKRLEWLGFTKYHMKFDFISGSWTCINPDHNTETYSEPCQISKMEVFAEIGNGWEPLTSFTRSSILDVYQGSEYVSVIRSDKISNNSESHANYVFYSVLGKGIYQLPRILV